jgi:hypothetical protein
MINKTHIDRLVQGIVNMPWVENCYCKHHIKNTIYLHSILKFAGQNYRYCQLISNVWVKRGNYLLLNSSLS